MKDPEIIKLWDEIADIEVRLGVIENSLPITYPQQARDLIIELSDKEVLNISLAVKEAVKQELHQISLRLEALELAVWEKAKAKKKGTY